LAIESPKLIVKIVQQGARLGSVDFRSLVLIVFRLLFLHA
jgi:hypothetical protein